MPLTDSPEHQMHLARWKNVFGEDLSGLRARGKHCKDCSGLAISGRTVIAEVVWIDEPSRRFIQNCDMLGWEKHLKEQGWESYRERALDLVRQGICDPLDAEKVIGEISLATDSCEFDYRQIIE